MNPNLDPYYASVVPRLIPSQHSNKRIPMSDEGYQYGDTRPISSYMSPQGYGNNQQPLSSRIDLNQSQDNRSFYNNSIDKPFNGRINNGRFHHEPLKDNSFDQYPTNSYPNNSDYRSLDNSKENSINKSTKIMIIIFGLIIALFSLTALAISIYLLIRISNSTTTTSG